MILKSTLYYSLVCLDNPDIKYHTQEIFRCVEGEGARDDIDV